MIIVDGYNFLYALHGLEHTMPIKDMDAARTGLHELLTRFHNITREHVRVVYDARTGAPLPSQEMAGVTVVYAPANVSADDYIVRFVKKAAKPARITVVTSDKALAELLKTAGARVMKASSFHKRMLEAFEKGADQPDDKAYEKPGRPSPDEIELFMRAFTEDTGEHGPDDEIET